MSKPLLELQQAILGTSLVQPVATGQKGSSIWVLSRQLAGQDKPWLRIVESLLEIAEKQDVQLHVCRRYVRKNGKMVFGWHVELTSKSSKELMSDLEKIKSVFEDSRPNLEDPEPAFSPVTAPTSVRPSSKASTREPEEPEMPYQVPSSRARGKGPKLPQGTSKVTYLGVDENGKDMTIEEIALPHITTEQNVPKHQWGRGARYIRGDK